MKRKALHSGIILILFAFFLFPLLDLCSQVTFLNIYTIREDTVANMKIQKQIINKKMQTDSAQKNLQMNHELLIISQDSIIKKHTDYINSQDLINDSCMNVKHYK